MACRDGLTHSGRRSSWTAAALLCGLASVLLPGTLRAQQSTELAGAGGGTFPAGSIYNGVTVTGMRFGMGVDLASAGPVVGTFEFTLLGLSAQGQPQIITIEGSATGGSGLAGASATVLGTTSVDMGDGTPPLVGRPFALSLTTDVAGLGTMELVIDATSLPPATVVTGALTVGACQPDFGTLLTDDLCGGGVGLVGTHWISLPSYTPLKTAHDLCAALGPAAVSVTQRFPESGGTGVTVGGTWTYDCGSQTCTPGSASTPATEPGCPSTDCFCINTGEGYEVKVSAPTAVAVRGCESQVPVTLPAGGTTYLISVPIVTNLHTFEDLALYIGLQSTGIVRGSVAGLNGCTGSVTSCTAGTAACSAATLVPGNAYRVRYTHMLGATFVNPTTSTAQCPPPC